MNATQIDSEAGTPAITATASGRMAAYILLIVCAVIAAAYYRLRRDTVFGCQASGYSTESFLSYCQTDGYGDFDHGAFWFGLEPEATHSAAAADLLFLGNSRLQYGFSTTAARTWLDRHAPSYYVLGFAYYAQVVFHRALLERLQPRARMYVINLDAFFENHASAPARMVMSDPGALAHYRGKRLWQIAHREICGRFELLCGHSYAIFRSRRTGMWEPSGAILAVDAASFDPKADSAVVSREIAAGRAFIDGLGVAPGCVIFTLVPTVDTPSGTSAAIAAALHVPLIAPQLDDLLTFDGSHLDRGSAERWSAAFFEAAGPQIEACLRSTRAARSR